MEDRSCTSLDPTSLLSPGLFSWRKGLMEDQCGHWMLEFCQKKAEKTSTKSKLKVKSSIVVEIPPYNRKATGPVQVQFYVSNGRRRRSLNQNFTYLPGVRRHLPLAAGVKQERWEPDLISHNPPGFCPPSSETPSHDRVLSSDVAYYDSCDLPVRCGPASQNAPGFHHPPPSSVSLHTLMFPQTSSIQLQSPSMPSQTPHQTLIALQTSTMPPQTFTIPSQNPVHPQITTIPPQGSSVPPQSFTISPNTSLGGPRRGQSPVSLSSRSTFVTAVDPQKDTVLSGPGQTLSIKQEPEDQPNLGSLGLQEITLDDVNEIIDRDIGSLSGSAQPDQLDQYHRYDWEHKSSDAALPFCGGPQ